jgi:hypothetical protein
MRPAASVLACNGRWPRLGPRRQLTRFRFLEQNAVRHEVNKFTVSATVNLAGLSAVRNAYLPEKRKTAGQRERRPADQFAGFA